jgi:uncharacterized protein
MSTSPAPNISHGQNNEFVQISGVVAAKRYVPSRFNARSSANDGTLILYNSYTGAISGFPAKVRPEVERLLHKEGFNAVLAGLPQYLYERGYLVEAGTNELHRARYLIGSQHYRQDQLEFILLPSEECNFRCVYCYETFPRGTMEPWVRKSVISLLERRAPSLKSFQSSWFGGEPLLGLEAIRELGPAFVEICRNNDIAYNSTMTTNGYLLTSDVFQELISWNIRKFQITLDGAPEDHNSQRVLKGGGKTFDRILDNLRAMSKTKENFKVFIRTNFNPDNLKHIDEYLGALTDLKNDSRFVLRFYAIGKWGGPNDQDLEICGQHGEKEREELDVLASQLGYNVETRLPYMQARSGSSVCYAARPYNFIIGADGKIMKCTIVLDTESYNIIGHMTEDGRAEIDLDKLNLWVAPYFEEDAACKKCFYLPSCQGCSCPLSIIAHKERPCPEEKKNIKRSLQSIWDAKQASAHRHAVTTA